MGTNARREGGYEMVEKGAGGTAATTGQGYDGIRSYCSKDLKKSASKPKSIERTDGWMDGCAFPGTFPFIRLYF